MQDYVAECEYDTAATMDQSADVAKVTGEVRQIPTVYFPDGISRVLADYIARSKSFLSRRCLSRHTLTISDTC
jgi:hypothetical protein